MLTWHGAQGHVVYTKSSGDPELENRAQVVSLPANRTRGYRELRDRAQGHVELPLHAQSRGSRDCAKSRDFYIGNVKLRLGRRAVLEPSVACCAHGFVRECRLHYNGR